MRACFVHGTGFAGNRRHGNHAHTKAASGEEDKLPNSKLKSICRGYREFVGNLPSRNFVQAREQWVKPQHLSSGFAYSLRVQTFTCQQEFELIGAVLTPGGCTDRNRKTVRRKLAGQYHRIDHAGTDVGGMLIISCRFDNECHGLQPFERRIAKPFSKWKRNEYRLGAPPARAHGHAATQ
jgi:hypothetical protein